MISYKCWAQAHRELVDLAICAKEYMSFLLDCKVHQGYISALKSLIKIINDLESPDIPVVADALSRSACVVDRVGTRIPAIDEWCDSSETSGGITLTTGCGSLKGSNKARENVYTGAEACRESLRILHDLVAREPEEWARVQRDLNHQGKRMLSSWPGRSLSDLSRLALIWQSGKNKPPGAW